MNTRKSTIACLTALGVCAAAAMMVEPAVAQATRSEFLPTDKTCSQVVWRDDILERYAKINIACKEIVITSYSIHYTKLYEQCALQGLLTFIP